MVRNGLHQNESGALTWRIDERFVPGYQEGSHKPYKHEGESLYADVDPKTVLTPLCRVFALQGMTDVQ